MGYALPLIFVLAAKTGPIMTTHSPILGDQVNKRIASAKNFYNRHQKKIVIGTLIVTTTGTVLMFRNQKQFNQFLKEHNLFDEFYFLTEE